MPFGQKSNYQPQGATIIDIVNRVLGKCWSGQHVIIDKWKCQNEKLTENQQPHTTTIMTIENVKIRASIGGGNNYNNNNNNNSSR